MRLSYNSALILTFAIMFLIAYPHSLSSQEPVKILFIGSSYFNYNKLPEIFRELSEQGGEELIIDQHIPSGLFLQDQEEARFLREIGSNTVLDSLQYWNFPALPE